MANTGLLAQDWGEAFLVALRWAHRNLPRITDAAIGDAEARLFAAAGRERDPTPTPVPEVLPTRGSFHRRRSCHRGPVRHHQHRCRRGKTLHRPGLRRSRLHQGSLPRRPSRPPAPLSPPRRTSPPATTPPASPPPVRTLRSRPPPSPPASPPPASPPPVRTPRSRRPPPSPPRDPTARVSSTGPDAEAPRRPPPVAVGRATLPAVVPPNVKECSLRCPVCEGYRDHWVSKVRIKETNKIEFKMACLDCGKHYRDHPKPSSDPGLTPILTLNPTLPPNP